MASNMNTAPGVEVQVFSVTGDDVLSGDQNGDGSDGSPDGLLFSMASTTAPSAPPLYTTSTSSGIRYGSSGAAATAITATPPVVMMTAVTPRVFTGLENEDAKEWLDHYELVCKSNSWSEELKLNRVVTALAG